MTRINAPGYQRGCMRCGCDAVFNILTGEGLGKPTGWRQLTRVVPGYLCPVHAPAVTPGGHVPYHLSPGAPPGMCGVGCACGWEWAPSAPATAGAHWDA